MTPPDSGDLRHECRCGYRIVGRDAEGPHTWSKCKPDSGEREMCGICRRPRGTEWNHRGETHCWADIRFKDSRCYLLGYERLAALVGVEPDLAQRILAALERDIWTELASELRARLPR